MKVLKKLARSTPIQLIIVGLVGAFISFFAIRSLHAKPKIAKTINCQSICVSLSTDGIHPGELAVKVGEIVQFNTADGMQHNIGLGNPKTTDHMHTSHTSSDESGIFGPGEAWRVQFKEPGTYQLHDHLHPELEILVVAYNPTTK